MDQDWFTILSKNGYRLTGSRRAVVDVLCGSTQALSPLEIFERARQTNPEIGLVSVYRTLEKLEELKLIQRVHQPAGCQAFMVASQQHQHMLLCSSCGEIRFFEGDDLGALIDTISVRTGYNIEEHWLQLFGQCEKCRTARAN